MAVISILSEGPRTTNPLRASLALTEPNGQPCLTPTPSLTMSSYIIRETLVFFFYFLLC